MILGYRALQNDGDLSQAVLDACLKHHERLDGSGYPHRLLGEKIPWIARMAAICDSFEFLLAGTKGKPVVDPAAAINELRAQVGSFDEEIMRTFIETVGLYPIGAFVELANGKLAMVIDEDRDNYLRPVVQVFYCLERRERTLPHRLSLAHAEDRHQIVGIADLNGLDLPEHAILRELIFLTACRPQAAA